jgi:rRNA maturation endonuclease Nob1
MGTRWYSYHIGITDEKQLIFRCLDCGNISNTSIGGLCDFCSKDIDRKKLEKQIKMLSELLDGDLT